jgi:glutamate formiminotransferase
VPLAELPLGFTERASQLGKLGTTEEQKDDEKDDEELGYSEIGHETRVAVLVSAVNVSEGRDEPVLARLVAAGGDAVLDVHRDAHHHRSVITVAGEPAVRAVATAAVAQIDLRRHSGVHPRLGAIDVVPFVPYGTSTMLEAERARDAFAEWIVGELGVPALIYREQGPTLPQVRRTARLHLLPHPTAGAVAVGARRPLVAYNVWLQTPDLPLAKRVAAAVRGPAIRALGLPVGERVQVSMNLVDPQRLGPAEAFDAVAALTPVAGAELVGLVPDAVLAAVPPDRWIELDLDAASSVEARLNR